MQFEELKQRHAAMWGSAPFERVAETLAEMHARIVETVEGRPGERWLDVGCGTGELAFLAAATGATVTGADLSPALVDTAKRQARERNVDVAFEVGDAESLPFPDESFDIVTSSVGAIFAPDHGAVASELARTCRPGGRLALSAWATDGGVDEFFEIIGKYAPPPPPGAGTALAWGEATNSEKLLGEAFELTITTHNTPQEEESGEAVWELLSTSFGPIKTLLGNLPEERAQSFHDEMVGWLEEQRTGDVVRFDRVYHLVSGVRRS
jgi:SAM-dependent methyltransferase